ncbi:MAG: S8 family peptidase [Verrucomicrobia bacterium]|nr:S8 family peptidase [Cytophagales bacterium]
MQFKTISVFAGILCTLATFAQEKTSQEKAPQDWFHLDFATDKYRGVSTQKAYDLLKGKKSTPVIVAVIDGGTDVMHEDLKDRLWTNTKEIAGNGKDDDKNGYADDVHGWNFIGGKDGKNVDADNFEALREMVRLGKKFKDKTAEELKQLSEKDKTEYQTYLRAKEEVEKKRTEYQGYAQQLEQITKIFDVIRKAVGKENFTKKDVENITSTDANVKQIKEMVLSFYDRGLTDEEVAGFKEQQDEINKRLNFGLNPDFDPRSIVGDNYADVKEKSYGNADVAGPRGEHGTHVAGIIGATRDNKIGMDGVCDNVKLMIVRTVPDGDERDKDVANAIRYAVDNGAKVINMSFGKDFSPNREVVDEAIKYAASKNVLLVHAAGNDAKDIDTTNNFPTNKFANVKNWLEIGASSWGDEKKFVADFSNYGKKSVDVFAPGVDIYSTIPGNKYKNNSGTSMASPVTAGVAALLLSYFPDFSAEQIKEIIIKSSVKYVGTSVNKPGEKEVMVDFAEFSNSAGIVNAFEAVKLAMTMKPAGNNKAKKSK